MSLYRNSKTKAGSIILWLWILTLGLVPPYAFANAAAASFEPISALIGKKDAIAVIIAVIVVPVFNIRRGFLLLFRTTKIIPIIDAMIPIPARIIGSIPAEVVSKFPLSLFTTHAPANPKTIAAIIEST